MTTPDPIARRWPRDMPLPTDTVYRSVLLEHMAAGLGFPFDLIRMWRDEPHDATVIQAHRAGMFAENVVDYGDPRWREVALERLDRAFDTSDSTATTPADSRTC